MNKNYLWLFITALIGLPVATVGISNAFNWDAGLAFMIIVFPWLVACILLGIAAFQPTEFKLEKESTLGPLKPVKNLVILLAIVFCIPFNGVRTLYNQSVVNNNNYQQKCQERPLYYDAMWKTFTRKGQLTELSKATFIQIATVIMDARKDGQSLSWKWVQENTQIPFQEFTTFYKDLSTFIESKTEGYFQLERECQILANTNNILLKTWPNNLYNLVLNRPIIEYKAGFTSDSTIQVFNTGMENIK